VDPFGLDTGKDGSSKQFHENPLMIVMVLGGGFIVGGLGYYALRSRGIIPAASQSLPRFNNPFGGGGGFGGGGFGGAMAGRMPPQRTYQPQQPSAPYPPSVVQADGMPVARKQTADSSAAMFGNPMMMGSGDTLDSFFSTGDKLIGSMMMGGGTNAGAEANTAAASPAGEPSLGLGLSNPLFAQLSGKAGSKVSSEEIEKGLKSIKHVISKSVDGMDDKDAAQDMVELAGRALKSWEKAEEGGSEKSESEKISNLVDVKVTLNKLEQVSYMCIQMPAGDKTKLMNVISEVRGKLKSYGDQTSSTGKVNMKRSSIISSMTTLKAKMSHKVRQQKLKR